MKTCRICLTNPVAKFEHKKCHTCWWEGVALDRTARDMGEAERLRKEADAAFEAVKQEFLDFERGEEQ